MNGNEKCKIEKLEKISRPPIYTMLVEVVGWTMDRTVNFPKSQRFTYGQRLDNLALDGLQVVVKAIFSRDSRQKIKWLEELLLILEQKQVLWRLTYDRRWISLQQLAYVSGRLEEIGRMANGWRQQQMRKAGMGRAVQ